MQMRAANLHNRATTSSYLSGMRRKQLATRAVLAVNLRALMDRRDWTQKALEKASGVSQRHISSLLNQKQDCTTEILAQLAEAFRLPGWLLLIPDLAVDLLDSQELPLLVRHYIGADPDGRAALSKLAQREFHLNPERQKVVPLTKSKPA
jgi:transcriptional regulator with XRE-family HTH domain